MNTRPAAVIACLVSLSGVGLAAGVLHRRETTRPLPESTARLMYLRSGNAVGRAFLSFDALAADVYWIRTIQHYGRDRKSSRSAGRFELLQPLLDLTTTLDPHFNIAYRFGAIFLSLDPPDGPARPDQAIALLEKGLRQNPSRWQYAHDIGFVHYWYTGNYREAAVWFDHAAGLPGAPEWIRPMGAITRVQGGDRNGARRLLTELLSSEQSYVKGAAERALAQLQALDAIDQLHALIEHFRTTAGRYPSGWLDLVRSGVLPGVPADATGEALSYDSLTHAVTLSPKSGLQPLPRAFGAR